MIIVEILYMTLFIGMLVLKLNHNSMTLETKYTYFGTTMIVIICLILGAFIILGFAQTVEGILRCLRKRREAQQ